MPVTPGYPEQTVGMLNDVLNAGDLDGAMGLFEPDALLVASGGTGDMRGHGAIRQALDVLLRMKPTLDTEVIRGIQAEGVGLVVYDWSMEATADDGSSVNEAGRGVDVVRRQTDGRWLIAIKNPTGAA
jgi:uncharacterized protein (TIGR02246 family)